jgi:hypothetical protein
MNGICSKWVSSKTFTGYKQTRDSENETVVFQKGIKTIELAREEENTAWKSEYERQGNSRTMSKTPELVQMTPRLKALVLSTKLATIQEEET